MFIGIDVAKDRLDVHVRPSGEAFSVTRDGEGIDELAKRFEGSGSNPDRARGNRRLRNDRDGGLGRGRPAGGGGQPRQIRDFARATARLAKTDTLDAAVIAHFAEAVKPPPRPLADPQARLLG